MTSIHLRSRRSIAAVALSLCLAACGDSIAATGAGIAARVAVTTNQGGATLYVQDIDGGHRTRIRFTNVTNAVRGNPADVVVIADLAHMRYRD